MTLAFPHLWIPRPVWTPPVHWAMDKMRREADGKGCKASDGKAQDVTCCVDCPAPDYGSLPSTLAISGYSNTFFNPSGCAVCPASVLTPWDGTFTFDAGSSTWKGTATTLSRSINGKLMREAFIIDRAGSDAPCWQLFVRCGSTADVWAGSGGGSGTPLGTYTRGLDVVSGGCDTTPTITIV